MQMFTALDPRTQISGSMMLAFVECAKKEKLAPILVMNQLLNIQPERWYPVRQWMNVLGDIALARGGSFDLVAVGAQLPQTVAMPDDIDSLGGALSRWNNIYRSQFRYGDPGWYEIDMLNERHYKVTDRTPWPRDIALGILQGLARRYVRPIERFEVHTDLMGSRSDQPLNRQVYHVTWRLVTGALDPNRVPERAPAAKPF